MKNILCVHQGYELYGSDRMFMLSLKGFRKRYGDIHITVHLPVEGILSSKIIEEGLADEVIFSPMAVLRKSDFKKFNFSNVLRGLFILPKKVQFCNSFDLIYINSIVVFDYLLASRFSKSKCIVHIHEIVDGIIRSFFEKLLLFSKTNCIFVSQATKNAFTKLNKGQVVLNGIKGFDFKERAFSGEFKILQIGRINSMKGHDILLKALVALKSKYSLKVRIIGDVFDNQNHYKNEIYDLIKHNKLEGIVDIRGFSNFPSSDYEWADIVVIPSKKPESFGLVAIESMSVGSITLASKIGGLAEIFNDGESGFYFEPNNVDSLVTALEKVLNSNNLCKNIARKGNDLYEHMYTEEAYINRFQIALDDIC
ncbi:Glycosyltransferase involved in cell wall bisynthesis [Saccharicrinis carchari]|uniref:Glycosyltransferase involved in cell wall bisynthesis n=1 Tax=Saccharicrinis carchari TaxID=1168039 RepID=A0A521EVA6_SACCC|nr:glycosyltransferase family 4 protein [Saccharicrinis carchari]SMO87866.1 Glycosyltransferase involved in cell wall bisynthesis [Saccharicrinis carchari]